MAVQMVCHVGFVVNDLERSLEWFTKVLGFQVERQIRELSGE